MPVERCNDCRFYKSYGDFGQCRRFPPVADRQSTRGVYVTVGTHDWCGEWQAKPETDS